MSTSSDPSPSDSGASDSRVPTPNGAAWLRAAQLTAAAYGVVLLVAVLWPMPHQAIDTGRAFSFFPRGWLADIARNVVLFAPVGLGLALRMHRPGRAALVAFGFSVAIESAQLAIPGRFSSPVDVVSNTLGGALGALIPSAWVALRELERRRPGRVATGLAAFATSVLIVSSGLLHSTFPDAQLFGGWTPDYPGLGVYAGRVVRAQVGEVAIAEAGPSADSAALHAALSSFDPIIVDAIAGPRPEKISPLVTIVDTVPNELMFLAVEADDLVYIERTRAAAIGLHAPRAEVLGALAGVERGTPFSVKIERSARARWLRVDDAPAVLDAPAPGRTWALWFPDWAVAKRLRPALDVAWTLLLILPPALLAGRSRAAWGSLAALVICAAAIHRVGPLGPPAPLEWATMIGALVAGAAVSWRRKLRATR